MIRKILFSCFAILIVMGAVIAALILTVNPNDLKSVLQQEVMAKTGRQLIIRGDMHWQFWPELGFSAKGLSLRDDSEFHNDELIAIGKMSMFISPWDLFRHHLALKVLELSNVKLHWIRHKNGRINLSILFNDIRRASFHDPHDISSSWRVSLQRIKINNASMDMRDHLDQRHIQLTDMNAKLGRLMVDQSRHLSFNFHYDDGKRRFSSHGDGDFRVTSDLQQWSLNSLQQQTNFTGEFAKQGIKQLKIDAGIAYDAHQKRLNFRPFSMKVNQQNALNGQFMLDLSKQPVGVSFTLSTTHLHLPAGLTLLNRISLYHGPAFNKIHAQGQFKADQVELGKIRLGNLLTDIELLHGSFELKQVTSDFYSGNLTASGSLDLGHAHAKVRMESDLVGVSASELIKSLCRTEKPITGTLRLSAQLEGMLPIDHLDQLQGRMQVNLSQSSWPGVNLHQGILEGMTEVKDLKVRVHLDHRKLLWDTLTVGLEHGAIFQGKGEWTATRNLKIHLKSNHLARSILFSHSCSEPIEQITRH